MGIPINVEERFDILSLARQVKNIGRPYQRQAIELVNLCRMFVEKFPPEKRHNAVPKLTMLAIFEALRLADAAGKKTTDKASAAFQEAKVKLLRYRAIVHPGLQSMDATISERMTRAKEKDERTLELFNQLVERRGPNETSTFPIANARIRMGRTDRQIQTKAQVATSHTAVAPTVPVTSHALPASALIHVISLTRVKVDEGQRSLIDRRYIPSSPQTLIYRASLSSISRKRPTAGFCSTVTTTHSPQAPGASESLEARILKSPSNTVTVTPAIQQSSFKVASTHDIQASIVQERPENVSPPPSGILPHFLVPPSSHSSPQSTCTDPPPNAIDVPLTRTVSSERQILKVMTQRSSNSLPQSEEKKVPPIHNQTKLKESTRNGVTQKSSTKSVPSSLTPCQPGPPATRREAPSRLTMPGTFPGTLLDDMDMSSWVLVSPVNPDCRVEVPKRSWFKRMVSRFG